MSDQELSEETELRLTITGTYSARRSSYTEGGHPPASDEEMAEIDRQNFVGNDVSLPEMLAWLEESPDLTVTITTSKQHPLLTPEERHSVKAMGEFRIAQLLKIRNESDPSLNVADRADAEIDLLVSALTKLRI